MTHKAGAFKLIKLIKLIAHTIIMSFVPPIPNIESSSYFIFVKIIKLQLIFITRRRDVATGAAAKIHSPCAFVHYSVRVQRFVCHSTSHTSIRANQKKSSKCARI